MLSTKGIRGFTMIELVVVLVVIAFLLVILWPAGGGHREKARQTTCLSQVRQLATACLMFSQDNKSHFPGATTWVKDISTYTGSNQKIFWCPSDASSEADNQVSYGYSGWLACVDGSGVKESDIKSPTEVGVICDASPDTAYPTGGIVYGGALQAANVPAATPSPRHSNGTVVGYADGHAKYVPNGVNERDIANGVTRAFCMAGALGLVDNPVGGISDFSMPASIPNSVTVGGEPCTRALLLAAAGIWRQRAKAQIALGGFKGQYLTEGRGSCYLWGTGDGVKPAGASVAIARDEVVLIVAKNTKIPVAVLGEVQSGQYTATLDTLRTLFSTGYRADGFQAYDYDSHSGTHRFFTEHLAANGKSLRISKAAKVVNNDLDMVDTVANDPLGIGYCSSAIADPERITIVALKTPDGKIYCYPNDNPKEAAILPDQTNSPFTRTLYAECGGKAWTREGTGIANVMLAPNAPGTKALQAGPLFKASYFLP